MSRNYLKLNHNRMELTMFQKKVYVPYCRSWLTVPTATKLPWPDFPLAHPRSGPSHLHVLFGTPSEQCPASLPFPYHLLQNPFLKCNSDDISMLSIPQVRLTFKESSPILSPACELPDGTASASFPSYLYLPTKTHSLATAKLPAAAPHLPWLFMSLLAAWNALPSLFVHLVLPHSSKLSRMTHSG